MAACTVKSELKQYHSLPEKELEDHSLPEKELEDLRNIFV